MDKRLAEYYQRELDHLREMAKEFAALHPEHAGRLALDADRAGADPFVERLLEGFAFLTARIQIRFDAEFPRLTQSLLETIYPDLLSPTPAMAIVRFAPLASKANELLSGPVIPRTTTQIVASPTPGERTECTFRTAHDVRLWPLEIQEARYHNARTLTNLEFGDSCAADNARAALCIRLRTLGAEPCSKLATDELTFHLPGKSDLPSILYEQIFTAASAVLLQEVDEQGGRRTVGTLRLRRVGYSENEALFPYGSRSFQGYRLLREYFAFPQRFHFFKVLGLREALSRCRGCQVEVVIVLKSADAALESRPVNQSSFALFCTPVINLFEPGTKVNVDLDNAHSEHPLVVDKSRRLDHEVFRVLSVRGFGSRREDEQEFRPFYQSRDTDQRTPAYFTAHRVPVMSGATDAKIRRSGDYIGSEVSLSLVDAHAAPYRSNLKRLEVSVLCTNRHLLTLDGQRTFVSQQALPAMVQLVSDLSSPRTALPDGELAWRLVSHLSLNYLSLLDPPAGHASRGEGEPWNAAQAITEVLRLYARSDQLRQVQGLLSIKARPRLARVNAPGPISFARGLRVTIELDEDAFPDRGAFLLGAVLERFLARYVSLNSFTETIITTNKRGELKRWKPRIGRRPLL